MDQVKTITCTVCPRGCSLKVTQKGNDILVEGASCPRGRAYGREEMIDPRRMLTTSVWVSLPDGTKKRLPVRTSDLVPRRLFGELLDTLHQSSFRAPVAPGEVLIPDILSTGADIIASSGI